MRTRTDTPTNGHGCGGALTNGRSPRAAAELRASATSGVTDLVPATDEPEELPALGRCRTHVYAVRGILGRSDAASSASASYPGEEPVLTRSRLARHIALECDEGRGSGSAWLS